MIRKGSWWRLWVSALGAGALLLGCSTLNYREIQSDFNTAVQADNVRAVEALGALTGSQSDRLYESVRARLTDEAIGHLDARLQPNAYAIRAVAEWRGGRLAEARGTALAGLRLPNVAGSPRDEMVLQMIPALVIDEELVARFKAAGRKVSRREYDERYAADFATAADLLKKVSASVRPSTPESILYYVALQRWRVLQDWRIVIAHIEDGAEARQAALQDAGNRLGGSLLDEVRKAQELVPENEPIRKLMQNLALQ